MCRLNRFLFFFLLLLFSSTANAQERLHYFFRHISQPDGLLNDQVLSITQDNKGFIWIATPNGLQRYDGSRFIYYPDMLSDPSQSLTYGADIYADKKNNLLWVKKNYTLEKMELGKNKFTVYNDAKISKEPSFNLKVYKGLNNDNWLVSPNAVYHYDSSFKKNILYSVNVFTSSSGQASSILIDSNQNVIWAALGHQLAAFDKKNSIVYSKELNPADHPLLRPSFYKDRKVVLRYVLITRNQDIWVTTWGNEFFKYDHKSNQVIAYTLSAIKTKEQNKEADSSGLLINCMLEDDNNNIWIGTENTGLLKYNKENDRFDYCTVQENKDESIQYSYKIFSLFQDRQQNIWIGTDKGINIFNPYRQYFKSVRHEENDPLSINKNEIQSFIQTTNGSIFIGTWGGGIAEYDKDFTFKKNIVFTGPDEIKFNWCFQQVDDETMWIGCQGGYLVIYNFITGTSKLVQPPEIERSTIRCMEKDAKGNIWFGLNSGKIIGWDKAQNKFIPWNKNQPNILKLVNVINNILIDKSQHCWVSTESGFKEFDLSKRIFTNVWLPDKNNKASISGKTSQGAEELNDSTLIIGTVYGGLNFFNKNRKTFSHVSTLDGLASNNIYAIKKDSDGYIWFTTDYNLYKFEPVEKKIISYGMETGIINSSFTATCFYHLQNRQWLTFTASEAISFDPARVGRTYTNSSVIEITGFRLFDKPVFIDSLLYKNDPVNLSYKENFFTIEFAALDFSGLHQTNYFYRLKGIDKDWVSGGTKRFASYTDVQPGDYTFEVKADNEDNNGTITSLQISITPPFWKTNWFRILLLLAAVIIIYAIIKWRINSVRKEAKNKMLFNKQIAEMEMKALRSQMNPHFIFNCINSIDALIQSNDKYNATVYLNKFAKLIRNILDSSKQNTISLSKDLDTLKLYIELEQLRHEHTFEVSITTGENLLQDDYKVPPLIIQPFVENAILHGIRFRQDDKGKLSIDISEQDGYIRYIIEDNGVGRNITGTQIKKDKVSYGIQMSNDRVKLFNNEEQPSVVITDLKNNNDPTGTRVTVLLKIQ